MMRRRHQKEGKRRGWKFIVRFAEAQRSTSNQKQLLVREAPGNENAFSNRILLNGVSPPTPRPSLLNFYWLPLLHRLVSLSIELH